LSIGHTPIN